MEMLFVGLADVFGELKTVEAVDFLVKNVALERSGKTNVWKKVDSVTGRGVHCFWGFRESNARRVSGSPKDDPARSRERDVHLEVGNAGRWRRRGRLVTLAGWDLPRRAEAASGL